MLNEAQKTEYYTGIGGTLAASILGCNKYQSNVDAFLLLTDADYRVKKQEEISSKRQVKLGNLLEPHVLSWASSDKNWDIEVCEETLRDREYPFLQGHIDGRIKIGDEYEIVEIKTRGNFAAKSYGEEFTDEVQESEYMQCMHYLMLSGAKRCNLIVFFLGTCELKYFVIDRNDEIIDAMRSKLVDFWLNNVLANVVPAAISYQDASKAWPQSIPSVVIADEDIIKTYNRFVKIKKLEKKIKSWEDDCKLTLASFMQQNDTLVHPDLGCDILTYKTQNYSSVDLDTLRAKYPIIAEELTNRGTQRRMNIKKLKEQK